MKRAALIIAAIALFGCVEKSGDQPLQGTRLSETERAACLLAGGRAGYGGVFPDEVCFRPLKDAGKSCTKAGDCEGLCLSDTRTCSTVTPMFGCYNFLDEQGRPADICID